MSDISVGQYDFSERVKVVLFFDDSIRRPDGNVTEGFFDWAVPISKEFDLYIMVLESRKDYAIKWLAEQYEQWDDGGRHGDSAMIELPIQWAESIPRDAVVIVTGGMAFEGYFEGPAFAPENLRKWPSANWRNWSSEAVREDRQRAIDMMEFQRLVSAAMDTPPPPPLGFALPGVTEDGLPTGLIADIPSLQGYQPRQNVRQDGEFTVIEEENEIPGVLRSSELKVKGGKLEDFLDEEGVLTQYGFDKSWKAFAEQTESLIAKANASDREAKTDPRLRQYVELRMPAAVAMGSIRLIREALEARAAKASDGADVAGSQRTVFGMPVDPE